MDAAHLDHHRASTGGMHLIEMHVNEQLQCGRMPWVNTLAFSNFAFMLSKVVLLFAWLGALAHD